MKLAILLPLILALCLSTAARGDESFPKPTSHTIRKIEGWNVRIDDRLTSGPQADLGEKATKLLAGRLIEIELVVPPPALARLRDVVIELDYCFGDLRQMQYHPNQGWLTEHGYPGTLAKCVHIPDATRFLSHYENHRQPWWVLHELSHAYHDQVLGFDEPRIKAAYEKFKASGKYASVLTINGTPREHYALTNEKEFFAEMSETYFGTNDFYPFVAGELQRDEPEIYALLQSIWGSLPAQDPPRKP